MHKLLLPLATGFVALSTAAFAADLGYEPPTPAPEAPAPIAWNGLYFAVHGGAYWVPPVGTWFNDGSDTGETSTDTGYRFGGSIGYDFNPMFGVEAEVSYGHASLSSFEFDGGGGGDVEGDASNLTVAGNVIVGQQWGSFRPYLGVGAGAARVALSVPAGSFGPDGVDDSDWTWMAQAFAGVDFMITNNLSLGARYRFQYTGKTSFADDGGTPLGLDAFGAHSVEAVLKIRFGH